MLVGRLPLTPVMIPCMSSKASHVHLDVITCEPSLISRGDGQAQRMGQANDVVLAMS